MSNALDEYGPVVVSHLNFDRGRIHPHASPDASVGLDILHREAKALTLQIDGENLGNHLNVIDFGGLFSGNAIGPGRSVYLRLAASF